MTSSRLRSLPSARRICRPSPLPQTAIPAESYPRYSRRRRPSTMTGTTRFLPTYPTIPHTALHSCAPLRRENHFTPETVQQIGLSRRKRRCENVTRVTDEKSYQLSLISIQPLKHLG